MPYRWSLPYKCINIKVFNTDFIAVNKCKALFCKAGNAVQFLMDPQWWILYVLLNWQLTFSKIFLCLYDHVWLQVNSLPFILCKYTTPILLDVGEHDCYNYQFFPITITKWFFFTFLVTIIFPWHFSHYGNYDYNGVFVKSIPCLAVSLILSLSWN